LINDTARRVGKYKPCFHYIKSPGFLDLSGHKNMGQTQQALALLKLNNGSLVIGG
jgi:hypothetical protein